MDFGSVTGAINSATRTVSSVSSAATSLLASGSSLLSSGPASALSSISSAISGLLGGLSSLFKGLPTGVTLPLPNPLFAYASYTYVLSIGCLTDDDLSHPDTTYKIGKRIPLICKSANADPSNRVNTPYGKFDFFLDELTLDSLIGFEEGSGNTNVTGLTFQITEPYSMGLFIIAVQQLAQELGHDNWREAPFLLTIEFRGNTETGQIQNIPNTTRHIPFNFNEMSMVVNDRGSVYSCTAQPCNQYALGDAAANLQSDHSTVGSTVQEILQTGEKSLQAVINQRAQLLVQKGIVPVADEYIIIFPTNPASSNTGFTPDDTTSKDLGATEDPSAGNGAGGIEAILGLSRSSVNGTLIQSSEDVNALGQATLIAEDSRRGDPQTGKADAVYDPKSKTFIQGNLKNDPTQTEMKFSQDTNIPNAINQVLLQSDFVKDALDSSLITPEGYRGWWRIDCQVYNNPTSENMAVTGTKPKIIVYRVIPYKVHSSRMMPPNTKAPGLGEGGELEAQVVKHYNYIYTGKNVDILKFEIKVNNGFTQIMGSDGLTRTQDEVKAASDGGDPETNTSPVQPMPLGNPPSTELGVIPTIVKYIGTMTSTDRMGGGGQEGVAQRAARLFQDALSYSTDMIDLDMEIIGDPYFIAQSGMGNYTSEAATTNLNTDGSVNYQDGEVDIKVNFRTPIDLNQGTGIYDFGGSSKSAPVMQFSGVYCVNQVISTFSKGVFKQQLKGFRRPYQEALEDATPDQMFSTRRTQPDPTIDGEGE